MFSSGRLEEVEWLKVGSRDERMPRVTEETREAYQRTTNYERLVLSIESGSYYQRTTGAWCMVHGAWLVRHSRTPTCCRAVTSTRPLTNRNNWAHSRDPSPTLLKNNSFHRGFLPEKGEGGYVRGEGGYVRGGYVRGWGVIT